MLCTEGCFFFVFLFLLFLFMVFVGRLFVCICLGVKGGVCVTGLYICSGKAEDAPYIAVEEAANNKSNSKTIE